MTSIADIKFPAGLETLHINQCQIDSFEGIENLPPGLKLLHIVNNPINAEGLERLAALRRARPELDIPYYQDVVETAARKIAAATAADIEQTIGAQAGQVPDVARQA